jgi:ring-1,2-phenylacetyl-CoA epoxidase subunit PaaC
MQDALDALWPYTGEIFSPVENDGDLVSAGIVPDAAMLHSAWLARVSSFLQESSLSLPGEPPQKLRRAEHTPHLKVLLSEMQFVARSETGARW